MTKKSQQVTFRRFVRLDGNGGDIAQYIGIDAFMLREWIESKWIENMNWDNYGNLWVIDHIVPMRMFDLSKNEELNLCWNYRNLMPIYKIDNEKKNGNVYYSYILLMQIKGEDFIYNKLFNKIVKEVDIMDKYILNYINSKPFVCEY